MNIFVERGLSANNVPRVWGLLRVWGPTRPYHHTFKLQYKIGSLLLAPDKLVYTFLLMYCLPFQFISRLNFVENYSRLK